MSDSNKIRQFIKAHPLISVRGLSKATGINLNTLYAYLSNNPEKVRQMLPSDAKTLYKHLASYGHINSQK